MNPLQQNYEAMEDALMRISERNKEFAAIEDPERMVIQMSEIALEALKVLKEAPITTLPPTGKVTVITVKCNSDFWIVLHTRGTAKIAEFRYGDQGEATDSSKLTQNCAQYFGRETETLEIEPEFSLEGEPRNFHWELKSPSGKVYSQESEGACLEALIKEEPDAILQMALQPT
jgi:hypothetical protein